MYGITNVEVCTVASRLVDNLLLELLFAESNTLMMIIIKHNIICLNLKEFEALL